MGDQKTSVVVDTRGPSYLSWRGELLAELALARVPELVVTKLAANGRASIGFDYLAAAPGGLCFFVKVKAFSSLAAHLAKPARIAELRWSAPTKLIRQARRSHSPVFLFLFDADTDHGRYLRLDLLPEPAPDQRHVTVGLPVEQTISLENLILLLAEIHAAPAA